MKTLTLTEVKAKLARILEQASAEKTNKGFRRSPASLILHNMHSAFLWHLVTEKASHPL